MRSFGCALFAVFASVIANGDNDTSKPMPEFSSDRYPTGIERCAWLNWIADRIGASHLDVVKADLGKRLDSVNRSSWEEIGNGILRDEVIEAIKSEIVNMSCTRDPTMVDRCEGLSDVGCKFRNFAASDAITIRSNPVFNKTDGAVASPPNHKVVFENDLVRIINVYCPPSSLELAFHTHTRLSFWLSYGSSRGEIYWGYNGTALFDQPLWDRKEGSTLRVMWNGPEWFHMIQEKEPDAAAPGNCAADAAPDCPNGFKYRVELKLNETSDFGGKSLVRSQGLLLV